MPFTFGLLLPQGNPLVHVFELDSLAVRLLGIARNGVPKFCRQLFKCGRAEFLELHRWVQF
jgi:hypothetical protein